MKTVSCTLLFTRFEQLGGSLECSGTECFYKNLKCSDKSGEYINEKIKYYRATTHSSLDGSAIFLVYNI